jgi:hypothetical protein
MEVNIKIKITKTINTSLYSLISLTELNFGKEKLEKKAGILRELLGDFSDLASFLRFLNFIEA